MGFLADFLAEERDICHQQALERPYRQAERRARRNAARLQRQAVEAAAERAQAEAEAALAAAHRMVAENLAAAKLARERAEADWAYVHTLARVPRRELPGR